MSDTVQQIKERLSIQDVVSGYVKLTRAGKYWKGLSPFTKEKTPSFFVSPDRGLYHCFSTGKGGDMFTFVEEMEGVDFRGALKILAERAGVEITAERPGAKDERDRLYKALEESTAFFVETLKTRVDVLEYLTKRGLTEKTIESWGLGYASKEWQVLHDTLTKKGFGADVLESAGLIKRADSEGESQGEGGRLKVEAASSSKPSTVRPARFYDRFRGRIMFPINDVSGRVIAFSGRIFEDDPTHPQAKYLNSPETPVFDKSKTLYGLDQAREGIRGLGAVILVEGQVDLLMAHQAGYKNTVATSGTAFTSSHAGLLKRYTENLLIAYDGDRAGIAAAGRAASIALQAGMNVKITKLPPGVDPADLLQTSPQVFKESVKSALHVVDFYLAHIADAKYDARTFRLEVSRTVLPYVAMIPNAIDQAHFIGRVAQVLDVPEGAVAGELAKIAKGGAESVEGIQQAEPFLSRGDTIERVVTGLVLLFRERKDIENTTKAEEALKGAVGEDRFKTLTESSGEESRAGLFEADFFLERHSTEGSLEFLDELYQDLARETLHEKYRETLRALRSAEATHDDTKTAELMKELNGLASELR